MANSSITAALTRVSQKYKERVREIVLLLDHNKQYEVHYHRNAIAFKHDYAKLTHNQYGYELINADVMTYSGEMETYPTLTVKGDFIFTGITLCLYDAKSDRTHTEHHILIFEKSDKLKGGRTAC